MDTFQSPAPSSRRDRDDPGPASVTIPASPFMRKLGFGTGVSVYLMERSPRGHSRSPWAVKKINSGCSRSQRSLFQRRLRDEARILRSLRHPNIVGYRALAAAPDGSLCLAMEFGGERSLQDRIEERRERGLGAFPAPTVLRVALCVARGLQYLHTEQRLLHGDIKSPNVVVRGAFETVKICDVGVSLRLDENLTVSDPCARYVGSEPWLPPEALEPGGIVSDRSDVFALGLTLWEMLALAVPHLPPPPEDRDSRLGEDSRMEDSRLADSVLKNFWLEDSQGDDPVLKDSRLANSVLKDFQLEDSQLANSVSKDSRLVDSWLENSRLADSVSKDFQLANSMSKNSRLEDSRLADSVSRDSQLVDSRLEDSQGDDPVSKDSRLANSMLKDSRLTDSVSKDSRLEDSQLADSVLKDSQLEDSRLADSRLADSRLEDSQRNDPMSKDSQLVDSHLEDSQLADSTLDDSHLEDSHLEDSQLADSQGDDSCLEDSQGDDSQIENSQGDNSVSSDDDSWDEAAFRAALGSRPALPRAVLVPAQAPVLELFCACTAAAPRQRPPAAAIVRALESRRECPDPAAAIVRALESRREHPSDGIPGKTSPESRRERPDPGKNQPGEPGTAATEPEFPGLHSPDRLG
nr:lymphokine-activated killer T-cell-originated protein kinase [Taeniopygia guttata]